MISLDLAHRLAGRVTWTPRPGDRFAVPGRDLDDQVFVVSDMVVEVHDLPTGQLLRFNGTTEWALDSIPQDEVVWLPHEGQLRELLGPAFLALEATADGFTVVVERGGREERHLDPDAECAYARALLTAGPAADPAGSHDQ